MRNSETCGDLLELTLQLLGIVCRQEGTVRTIRQVLHVLRFLASRFACKYGTVSINQVQSLVSCSQESKRPRSYQGT